MAMEVVQAQEPGPDPVLARLSDLIHENAEIFAMPSTSKAGREIYTQSLQVAKRLFDESLSGERTSLPALSHLLADIRNGFSDGIETRSGSGKRPAKEDPRNNPIFRSTPLQELYLGDDLASYGTEGQSSTQAEISHNMIWEQLNLRIGKILDIYNEVIEDGKAGDEDDEDAESLEDSEDEEDEGMDQEELEEGMEDYDVQEGEDDDMMEFEDYQPTSDDEDEDDEVEEIKRAPYFSKLRDESSLPDDIDIATALKAEKQRKKAKGKGKATDEPATAEATSSVDSGFFSLADFHSQTYAGEDEMRRYIRQGKSKSVNDLSNGLDGEDEDDENEDIDYFAPAGGADDLDEDEDDEDGGHGSEDDDDEGVRVEDMKYSDFWNPPKQLYGKAGPSKETVPKGKASKDDSRIKAASGAAKSRRRVSFHDEVKVQEFDSGKSKRQSAIAELVKQVGMKEALKRIAKGELGDDDEAAQEEGDALDVETFDSDDDVEDDEEMEGDEDDEEMEDDGEDEEEASELSSEEDADPDTRTMRRIQNDLFADDDEVDPKIDKKTQQSRYEARLAALSEQIAELEAENVAERDWVLRGEAKSRDRPLNSLLEEDLEFDQVAKVVPVVTEESSLSLEDKIKKRILDEQFDDVVRRQAFEQAAYLPSKLLELKGTQSEKSLAEIYADEFSAERTRTEGGQLETPEVDAKLQKEHESIQAIFDELCGKLDALSNARFTPKPAQTVISTVTNLPSISLESALPTAQSTSTLMAPEEVFASAQRGSLTAKEELTPGQKKAARAKARKEKAKVMKSVQKYGGLKPSAKTQKERAMNSLIGKRGVTVLGKGKAAKSTMTGQDRKGGQNAPSAAPASGVSYKL